MSNRFLVIYNTCGISGRDNSDRYLECIQTIVDQLGNKDDKFIVSSCLNPGYQLEKIFKTFGNRVTINAILDKLPVNITCNHSAKLGHKLFGDFEGYIYIDSGCSLDDNRIFNRMHEKLITGEYGMVTCPTDSDNAFENYYGWYFPPHDFIVPIGKACNLHVSLVSKLFFDSYNQSILPDVFGSTCSESVLSFLNAAIGKKWLIAANMISHHRHSMDLASSGFINDPNAGWNHTVFSPRSMIEICQDPEGTACGFGYEECNGIKMHDPNQFDGYCAKQPERLRKFILDNIFIHKPYFDYDKINHEVI